MEARRASRRVNAMLSPPLRALGVSSDRSTRGPERAAEPSTPTIQRALLQERIAKQDVIRILALGARLGPAIAFAGHFVWHADAGASIIVRTNVLKRQRDAGAYAIRPDRTSSARGTKRVRNFRRRKRALRQCDNALVIACGKIAARHGPVYPASTPRTKLVYCAAVCLINASLFGSSLSQMLTIDW
jgi:hypothetical protein